MSPSRARVLSLTCALLLGLAVVAPALSAPGRALAGSAAVDAYGSWWFQWWVAHALATGTSPLHADVLFFPWGKDILTHTGGNLLDAALLAPVRWALGPVVSWNLLFFLAVSTNALAAGSLARRVGASLPAQLAAQVLVGLHPFVLNELHRGRPTQAILAPLFLALAAGDEAFRGGGTRRALAAGAWLALAAWIYWYAAAFGALALCVLAVGRPLVPRLLSLARMGATSIVLTAPLLVPLAAALKEGRIPGLLPLSHWWAGALDFSNAQGTSVQIEALDTSGMAGFLGEHGWAAEGLALGVVAAVPVLLAPRRWAAVGVLALVICLGPFPLGFRNVPYLALMEILPPFERLYWPVRALSVLAAVATVGVAAGLQRLPERARGIGAAVVALAALGEVAARGAWPIGSWEAETPAALACLSGQGAGIVLPYGQDQVPLVWQTVNEAPVLGGMAERSASLVPEEQRALRKDNGWLRTLLALPADPRTEQSWTEEEKAAIGALGYRWVVLRVEPLLERGSRVSERGRLRAVRRAIEPVTGPPVHEDDEVVVYAPWGGLDACR